MKHLQHSKYIDKVKTETKNKKRGEHQPKPSQAKNNGQTTVLVPESVTHCYIGP
jgi:hypothetical protein